MNNTNIWEIISSLSAFGAFIISIVALVKSDKAVKAVYEKKQTISGVDGGKIFQTGSSNGNSNQSLENIKNAQINQKADDN